MQRRMDAHANAIAVAEQTYADALAAAEPTVKPSTIQDIQAAGIAGLPRIIARMYGPPGAVVLVKPGSKAPARERIEIDERV